MQGITVNEPSPGLIALSGEMTIFHAQQLKSALLDCLNRNTSLQMDLSGVSELDSAGIQLLLMLQQEATRLGKALNLTSHSEAVTRALSLLGLERSLGESISIVWSE